MIVVAVASGTSADALDVAAVDLRWADGDVVEVRVLGSTEHPWPGDLGERLLALLAPATTTAAELCALDTAVGQAVGLAAAEAAAALPGGRAELVVSPGQTVHHEVTPDGSACLGTLQLGQPAWVAEATGLPVVSDLRARDVAAGGHGAPLASTLDALWLGADGVTRAALNLGGIANLTVVGPGRVEATDTGPGNCLLDVAARRVLGRAYDDDGQVAATGTVRDDLLTRLLDHPYLRPGGPGPRSTGREVWSAAHLDAALVAVPAVDGPDLLATLVALTVRTVADALPTEVAEVVVSGGGARNGTLLRALGTEAGRPVRSSAELGLDPDAKEVVLWALLGFLTWHGVAGTTGATGAPPRVLGRVTPGAAPLRLPQPRTAPARAVRVLEPEGVA